MIRSRRGSALILVLLMTLAVAGLSIAAIFMASSAGLLSSFYDREREYRLASESALERVRARLQRDSSFAIPDTGMVQVVSGERITDADGNALTKARVNVYAAVTGDTTGTEMPTITLIAVAYDAGGTRHVARTDLRRESFARYTLFTDSFPSGLTHGPGSVPGRVHSNGSLRLSGSDNRFLDTVSVVTSVTGSGTFDIDSLVGVSRVLYPKDSTYPRLDTLAGNANLRITPLSGGRLGTRIEFVAYNIDGDSILEPHEGFLRVFDADSGSYADTTRLRATPAVLNSGGQGNYLAWDDPIVQNQCGAFYLRNNRWHFFPVSTHRRSWADDIIASTDDDDYPQIDGDDMDDMDDNDRDAAFLILSQPTARCFPAGSPYLMPAERFTNASGVVTNTASDVNAWGRYAPPGGWPGGAPYGGSDTTFTRIPRNCSVGNGPTLLCAPTTVNRVGRWRLFPGTPVAGASVPDSVVQDAELPYLWPLHSSRNASSRGVVSVTSGPIHVSGTIAGQVTLRVNGRVTLVDELKYARDPNDPNVDACTNAFGLLAVGDILVVNGLTSRVRRISDGGSGSSRRRDGMWGAGPRFTMHGLFMSLGGTVGVEAPTYIQGSTNAQIVCPDNANGNPNEFNGGCLAVTGGMLMKRYTALHNGTDTGFRYYGATDRCQIAGGRPPFFPMSNRYNVVRTLAIQPNDARTPALIRTLLLRLKGKAL